MPMPVSRTVMVASTSSVAIATATAPARGVYFTALLTRLSNT